MSEELDSKSDFDNHDLYMLRKEMMEHQIIIVNIMNKIEKLYDTIEDIKSRISKIESANEAKI